MISTVRAMDLSDGGEISVTTDRDLVVLCDSTTYPCKRIYLTGAEALKLAEFLTDQADSAGERPMPEEWMHETARGIEDYRPIGGTDELG